MNKLVSISLLVLIFCSCSSKFSLQNRRYNKGYYFSRSNKNDAKFPTKIKQTENANLKPNHEENETIAKSNFNNSNDNLEVKNIFYAGVNTSSSLNTKNEKRKNIIHQSKIGSSNSFNSLSKGKNHLSPYHARDVNKKNYRKKLPLGWGPDATIYALILSGISLVVATAIIFAFVYLVSLPTLGVEVFLVLAAIVVVIALIFGAILLINGD